MTSGLTAQVQAAVDEALEKIQSLAREMLQSAKASSEVVPLSDSKAQTQFDAATIEHE